MEPDVHLLSPEVLRDLARNTSARIEFRQAAANRLKDLQHPHANHPEVIRLHTPSAESEHEIYDFDPKPELGMRAVPEIFEDFATLKAELGPFKASVTTEVLMQEDAIPNLETVLGWEENNL